MLQHEEPLRYADSPAVVLVVGIDRDPFFRSRHSISAVLSNPGAGSTSFTPQTRLRFRLRTRDAVLAKMIDSFHLLHYGLSLILVLIGLKMLASNYADPTGGAGMVGGVHGAGVDWVIAGDSEGGQGAPLNASALPRGTPEAQELTKTDLVAEDNGMLVLDVVLKGAIDAIVGSTTFFARQGRACDQKARLQDVGSSAMAVSVDPAGDPAAPLSSRDDLLVLAVPYHADALPHQRLHLLDELLEFCRLTIAAARTALSWRNRCTFV